MSDKPWWYSDKPYSRVEIVSLPWEPLGCMSYHSALMIHRTMFIMPYDKPGDKYSSIDGSCICTDLVRQGCVALVHVPGKGR